MKTMTTADDINHTALQLGWEVHEYPGQATSYLRGDINIQVAYTDAGTVLYASLYHFYRIDDLRLVEEASGRFKKATVVAWLAAD